MSIIKIDQTKLAPKAKDSKSVELLLREVQELRKRVTDLESTTGKDA